MRKSTWLLLRLQLLAFRVVFAPRKRDDRGDVPGWVLVTIMSAGLVAIIWTAAQDQLTGMLREALRSVR